MDSRWAGPSLLWLAVFCLCSFSLVRGDYLAINCGGQTRFDPQLPVYYQGVDYGLGPIYQPNNSYTSKAGVFYRTDAFYSGTSNHVSDYSQIADNSQTVTGTDDPFLYRQERYGLDLFYDINLPNGQYTVEMNFAESLYSEPNKRAFSISVNGVLVESNLDIVKAAGTWKKAIVRQYPAVVTNGLLHIFFSSIIYEATVNAMRIFSSTGNSPLPGSPNQALIDAGSSSDKWFLGGTNYTTPPTFAPALDAQPSEAVYYNTSRTDSQTFTYLINLQNGDYLVEMFFVETNNTNRTFDIAIQTVPVVRDLNVTALAGGLGRALVVQRSVTVPNELLRITFTNKTGQPFVNAIRVTPLLHTTGKQVAINCGAPLDVLAGTGVIFAKDVYFNGGTALVTNPYEVFLPYETLLDDFIYTTARLGPTTYAIPVPNGAYVVELRMAELQDVKKGDRVFNVTINDKPAFQNIDLIAITGAKITPLLLTANAVATQNVITIQFTQNATINAIYVRPGLPSTAVNFGVNCGGTDYTSSTLGVTFLADKTVCALNGTVPLGSPFCRGSRVGGISGNYSIPNSVNIRGTQDAGLYQTEAWGPVEYTFNLPNGRYNVTCLFAEIDSTVMAGQRMFNIAYNNVVLQPLYDPLVRAGGVPFTAAPLLTKLVTVTRGNLTVSFQPTVPPTYQPPKVSAIYISSA